MIELTPESEDELVVEVLTRSREALEDGKPRMDELLLIAALKRVISYYAVQK